MKRETSSMFLGIAVIGTLVALANIMFWGLTTFVVFSVLRWMGVL